eukprot:765189-Hanusia_phi.AAC.2
MRALGPPHRRSLKLDFFWARGKTGMIRKFESHYLGPVTSGPIMSHQCTVTELPAAAGPVISDGDNKIRRPRDSLML